MKRTIACSIVAVTALSAAPALACSICRCGDPTFNALGKEGIAQSGLRVAVDWDRVEKSQGPADERDLTETEESERERVHASGLADPEIHGQMRLWSSGFEGDVGIRTSLYAVLGVKTSWGENDTSQNGVRLDEHVQSGTGSTDWFGGLSGSYQVNSRSVIFASLQYRHTGRNDFG